MLLYSNSVTITRLTKQYTRKNHNLSPPNNSGRNPPAVA
uniref:Uncharacterized protein n=1 Tax=Rhizophora mucronata TaxID=61149 RepID=A0A2P2P901_RHIMU